MVEKLPVLLEPGAGLGKLLLLQTLGTVKAIGATEPDAGEASPTVFTWQKLAAGEAMCTAGDS